SWAEDPPFANDSSFSAKIGAYQQNLIDKYKSASNGNESRHNIRSWYKNNRTILGTRRGISVVQAPAVLSILSALQNDWASAEDLGALNRWPERTGIPLADYLSSWEASCKEINAEGRLLLELKSMFGSSQEQLSS